MPNKDSITLHTYDLTNLRLSLERADYVGKFKLVDDGDVIIVRDPNDFKIGSFKKQSTYEKANEAPDK